MYHCTIIIPVFLYAREDVEISHGYKQHDKIKTLKIHKLMLMKLRGLACQGHGILSLPSLTLLAVHKPMLSLTYDL